MFNLYFQGFVLAQWLQWATLVQGHVVLTYPGWRGNNLITNDEFPFGMQWMYPCKCLPYSPRGSTNRTHWPINGGAVAFQPGWFTGHENALIYVNIGLGEHPDNYSWPITRLYLEGPTDNPYPGTVCLSSLPLPEAVRSRVTSGDLATIQVVEAAKHGAGLFTVGLSTLSRGRQPSPDSRVSLGAQTLLFSVVGRDNPAPSTRTPAQTMGARKHLHVVTREALGACRCACFLLFPNTKYCDKHDAMKAIPSPVSASKAASHAHGRLPSIGPQLPHSPQLSRLPRHPAVVDSARAHRLAPASDRGAIALSATHAHAHNRPALHTRRRSGSKPFMFDAKVNKQPNHRTKIGFWLDNVVTPPPPSPRPRRKSTTPSRVSPHTSQIFRNPDSPRTPLADITPLVLAAESAANTSTVHVGPPPGQRSHCRTPDLTGAIDLLTADEARQLLLLSAQSNVSLATAIQEMALTRSPRPTGQIHYSCLADTFRFDEYPMPGSG
ncbi:hypothetical protein C8A00DRAFT_17350 [Chaetomidium leptoderma]|uniref:Copper acquisition factor BIM1-like domain-containing protein n=1 Tax=Chaetomidium leptoderma TaxID=669021 RepID=A0AAN6VGQ8_9PEZI|nr:hypothetical protein C8A00DRAFT_17350 [Chaetomidium leptoderma]